MKKEDVNKYIAAFEIYKNLEFKNTENNFTPNNYETARLAIEELIEQIKTEKYSEEKLRVRLLFQYLGKEAKAYKETIMNMLIENNAVIKSMSIGRYDCFNIFFEIKSSEYNIFQKKFWSNIKMLEGISFTEEVI